DSIRMMQVMNNLVSNAVKFTSEGVISLSTRLVNGFIYFDVKDSGVGMSAEDLEGIFDEFAQADSSQSRAVEGTGLGLTITRRLVQMHGGTIDATSKQGEGSSFTVKMPVVANVPASISTKQSDAAKTIKKVTGMLKDAIGIGKSNGGNGAS
ncbi:MAG: ATP-binding protein, partial [Chloroflexota bacterium]